MNIFPLLYSKGTNIMCFSFDFYLRPHFTNFQWKILSIFIQTDEACKISRIWSGKIMDTIHARSFLGCSIFNINLSGIIWSLLIYCCKASLHFPYLSTFYIPSYRSYRSCQSYDHLLTSPPDKAASSTILKGFNPIYCGLWKVFKAQSWFSTTENNGQSPLILCPSFIKWSLATSCLVHPQNKSIILSKLRKEMFSRGKLTCLKKASR